METTGEKEIKDIDEMFMALTNDRAYRWFSLMCFTAYRFAEEDPLYLEMLIDGISKTMEFIKGKMDEGEVYNDKELSI